VDSISSDIRTRHAKQQPEWGDPSRLAQVRTDLAARPALVAPADLRTLQTALGRVAVGEAHVVQSGDCAEDPAECTRGDIARKRALLDLLAGALGMVTHKPVIRAGRIAGQFAKPRSKPTEWVGGTELPVFRGHMVNSPEPDPEGRQADPRRMLDGYDAARDAMRHLGWGSSNEDFGIDPVVWTSHEALLLDYELPMIRRDEQGQPYLGSTHWPWIGARTCQEDGAHVALLSKVTNPVACKVAPDVTADRLLRLCDRLDPDRRPGRLTLIARMGVEFVSRRLPGLVAAVARAGHPAIWMSDPMHGNTVTKQDGLKTRYVDTVTREVKEFLRAVRAAGGVPGGLHLETTPDPVIECVRNEQDIDNVGAKYTSFCDPRLNPGQAVAVVLAWR
jgi:3-deoxy-7-phosphoheptulonate synthase